ESYLAFVDAQIGDPERVDDVGELIRSTSRDVMKEEHLGGFRELVEAFGLDAKLNEEQQEVFEGVFLGVLDEIYDQTRAVLEGKEGAIDSYNRLFKVL
ncbi:MAG: hypothetical protein V3T72_02005, partial [Thermoanaerobaculia bacterium]